MHRTWVATRKSVTVSKNQGFLKDAGNLEMLMSRRELPNWRETLRVGLWPRRSWFRSWRYAKLRLQRIPVRPRSLALGAAAGVFVAILPIPGVQLLAAAGLAWLVRGHRATAALATFAANPITYPLIWLSSYTLGATILGTPVADATHDLGIISGLMAQDWTSTPAAVSHVRLALPALTTLAVGALPLAVVSAAIAYGCVRHLLRREEKKLIGQADSNVSLRPRRAVSGHPIVKQRLRPQSARIAA